MTLSQQIRDWVDARLKDPRHEADDHLPRGLDVSKIKPSTASGDVLFTDSTGTAVWGTTGFMASMFLANSGAPTHTASGSTQKVGSGGGTSTWTGDYDTRPLGTPAQVDTTNKRLNVRKAGVYRVTARIQFSSLTTPPIAVVILVNGVAAGVIYEQAAVATSAPTAIDTQCLVLAAGDYVELGAYQQESASEPYNISARYCNAIQMEYLGPST